MEESILTKILLPLSLFIIMIGMGLSLVPQDFKRVLLYPKAVFLGLLNQMIFLPLIGYGLVTQFSLKPEHAVGIMVLAACPGGVTSNLFTHLAKGDTALSITLTAISSSITLFSIPLIVNFSLSQFMGQNTSIQLDPIKTMVQIFAITVFPVAIGMFINNKKPDLAKRSENGFKIFSALLLFLIVIAAILKERNHLLESFAAVGLICILLNLSSMGLGFFSSYFLLHDKKQGICISIESGIQNGTLGILIAATMLENPAMAIPPAIYSLVMFLTGFISIYVFGRMVTD